MFSICAWLDSIHTLMIMINLKNLDKYKKIYDKCFFLGTIMHSNVYNTIESTLIPYSVVPVVKGLWAPSSNNARQRCLSYIFDKK